MNKYLSFLLAAVSLSAQAQTPADTTVALQEVTVSTRSVIYKADRTLFLPTRDARQNCYNPYDLMFRMAMPRVFVDPVSKSVSASGGGVQLRINGVKATQADVAALLPKDIVRIELIEYPGKRYGDEELGAVIDLIVRHREAGGFVNFQTTNSPIVLFGENSLTARYNQGSSQWGVNYSNNYRSPSHVHTDVNEKFNFPERSFTRNHIGMDDRTTWHDHSVDLTYNYTLPEKYVFNVALRNYYKIAPHTDATSLIDNRLIAHTALSSNTYTPSLDLYFQRILPRQQTLTLNLTGTLLNTARNRRYTETLTSASHPFADITADVEGCKRSLILESIYDRRFKATAFSAGLRHYQMYDRNEYEGSSPVVSVMKQSRSSAFAEVQGQWHYLSYGISAGLTRSWFKENGLSHTYYTFTPTVRLSIAPHKNGNLSYRFSADPQIPALSALTDVEQAVDTIFVSRGNPGLKTYNVYANTLSYSYNVGRMMLMLSANYAFHNHCIMEDLFAEGNHIVIRKDNQRNYQVLNIAPTLVFRGVSLFGIGNFLTASIECGFTRYWSKGNSYTHRYNNFYYNAMLMLNYKEFSLMGQYRQSGDRLMGETVSKGENMSVAMLVWHHKRLELGAGILFPFVNNYRTGSERLSRVASSTSWTYVRETGNLFLLRLNYNFQFGKFFHTKEKRMHNSDREDGLLGM
ncbi:TonB-dependent receptor [Prevotella dentasini]